MKDKFEELIKSLPEEPMKRSGGEVVSKKVVRHYLIGLWEKRVSIISGASSVIFGVLMVMRIVKLAEILDTAGFWTFIGIEREYVKTDFPAVWQAFVEAHPLKEIGILVALIVLFCTSLYVLLKKEEW